MMTVAELNRTSIACPSQWEGALEDGRAVYIRYRRGRFAAYVGTDIDDAVDRSLYGHAVLEARCGEQIHREEGCDLDGYMEDEEMMELLTGVMQFPKGGQP